jgi:hypothetical protein
MRKDSNFITSSELFAHPDEIGHSKGLLHKSLPPDVCTCIVISASPIADHVQVGVSLSFVTSHVQVVSSLVFSSISFGSSS